MVVFLVSAQERRIGSWWRWGAWRTVSSLSIGTSFRTKPPEPPRKAGFRCSETSSLTNEQNGPRAGARQEENTAVQFLKSLESKDSKVRAGVSEPCPLDGSLVPANGPTRW